jgi:hypothetical protein
MFCDHQCARSSIWRMDRAAGFQAGWNAGPGGHRQQLLSCPVSCEFGLTFRVISALAGVRRIQGSGQLPQVEPPGSWMCRIQLLFAQRDIVQRQKAIRAPRAISSSDGGCNRKVDGGMEKMETETSELSRTCCCALTKASMMQVQISNCTPSRLEKRLQESEAVDIFVFGILILADLVISGSQLNMAATIYNDNTILNNY